MKVGGVNRPHVATAAAQRRVARRTQAQTGTKVAVSQEAKKLAEARSPATSDAAKVARLAEAIAHGQFMVDAEKLVDRMMDEER